MQDNIKNLVKTIAGKKILQIVFLTKQTPNKNL